ncbi:hypothetical protein BT63DRAFT_424809 [Microthyrium microscopicum]|uniref:Uncharacterized protein n=1 Tax=Microthyrium microscopicum TaxID=703497 RepID=A0A6A6UA11_9PEZI|nr:hypothetical protein BT63DRAFT_424809 [Microthyrium microscopicum]
MHRRGTTPTPSNITGNLGTPGSMQRLQRAAAACVALGSGFWLWLLVCAEPCNSTIIRF